MVTSEKHLLHSLARLYDIQSSYYDVHRRLTESAPEGILQILRILGAPVEQMADLADALREREQALWRRGIDPAVVAWDGGPLKLKLRLPQRYAEQHFRYQIRLENGEGLEGECERNAARAPKGREFEGARYVTRQLAIARKLPWGYHHLTLQVDDLFLESHLLSAPLHSYAPPEETRRGWGVFSPVYALSSQHGWGGGDISDLEALLDWIARLGGNMVGTLPLLATFLDEPFDPSPYAPVSRFFWNEFYLDLTRVPELHDCAPARALIASSEFQAELHELRTAPLVDYRRLMGLKRQVTERLARWLFSRESQRRSLFLSFVETHPIAQDYAAFRAKLERERKPWGAWPESGRDGTLRTGDYDEEAKNYHLYVQWQAHEQMRALGEKAKAGGPALYLDFPLGVHRDGYDVWREREVFALAASGGAPPDGFFTKGQNWGFPPLHPEGLRRQGYRYYIQSLRHHLQYSGMLRIDHVMGLHRLFWIPHGFEPTQGVYVRYPFEEFYAVLNLESHRHRARIVGENLGTVPAQVNTALEKHRIYGMYVGQFGIRPDAQSVLEEIAPRTVASLNTHDTPTFAAFWSGADIDDRHELGLLADDECAQERHSRALQREALVGYLKSRQQGSGEPLDAAAALKAWLSHLCHGDADLLLVSLEDLWLELHPQNVPGTWEERPNWRRKARYPLEAIVQMPSVVETLRTLSAIRKPRR